MVKQRFDWHRMNLRRGLVDWSWAHFARVVTGMGWPVTGAYLSRLRHGHQPTKKHAAALADALRCCTTDLYADAPTSGAKGGK